MKSSTSTPAAISLLFDIQFNTHHVIYLYQSVTYKYQGEKLYQTILRQWSQCQGAERRNLQGTQPQREDHWADDCVIKDGAALLHKTEDSRGQQRYTTKVCKHKYSQHILSNFIDDYYFLYLQMPGLPKHPTLIDYHTSNWGLVLQATAVYHWTPPGL
jgi:hypothetical protein